MAGMALGVTGVATVKNYFWPGYTWCYTDTFCPLPIPIYLDIAFAVAVCLVSISVLLLALILLFAPGAAMNHPRINKTLSIFAILLLCWCMPQTLMPLFYRTQVQPLYAISPYNVAIEKKSIHSAEVTFSNVYVGAMKDRTMMIKVVGASPLGIERNLANYDRESLPLYLSPAADIATVENSDFTMSATIDGLIDGSWYLFVLAPTIGTPIESYLLFAEESDFPVSWSTPWWQNWDGQLSTSYNRVIDLRAYRYCQWSSSGCHNNLLGIH